MVGVDQFQHVFVARPGINPTAAACPAAAGATAVADPPRAPATMPPPVAPAPPPLAAPFPGATHRVVAPELPGYALPAGDTATRVLGAGTGLQQVEGLPGWLHVRTVDGWQGWVSEHGVARL